MAPFRVISVRRKKQFPKVSLLKTNKQTEAAVMHLPCLKPARGPVESVSHLMLTWKDLGMLTSKPPDQVQSGVSMRRTHSSWS